MATVSHVITVQLAKGEEFIATVRYRRHALADFKVYSVTRDGDVLFVRGRSQRDGYIDTRLSFDKDEDEASIAALRAALRHVLEPHEWRNVCF